MTVEHIMTLQSKIKEVPGLQYVTDSMELMSAAGRRRMLEQIFLTDTNDLHQEQTLVTAMRRKIADSSCAQAIVHLRHQLMQLHDIKTTLYNLQTHTILDEVELFEIKNLAHISGHARKALGELELAELFGMPALNEVFDLLDPDHTGIPNFYIYDSYDIRLAPIRKQMKMADDSQMADLLAQQNEIQNQVIISLGNKLYHYCQNLIKVMEQMAYIDFTMARAQLTIDWNLTEPKANGQPALQSLVNPRLKQHNEKTGLRYQPVDISLTPGVTFITGANMAGKTVLLKSVGVAQLMYQFGFPIPAESATMEPVDDVVFCIGDEQNEMNGLSSFASEITRISEVIRRSQTEKLLVLIDEPARTTNPIEGKALVQAIANIMQSRNSFTMITTHYSQLGIDCRRLRVRGFVETMVDMPLTAQNINRFIDYSLVPDQSDEVPQEALRIAEMLECDSEMIAQARQFLNN